MLRRTFFSGVAATLGLTACGTAWQTDYTGISQSQSANWRLAAVRIVIPPELTVSDDENRLAPEADIVWQGEPAGDRRQQVIAIMDEGVRRGGSGLSGSRPVAFTVTVFQFHALSKAAVARLNISGVHNVQFALQVNDARTGELLASEELIDAQIPGFVGQEAVDAVARGETQKVRITRHIAAVTAGWLGIGPDARGSFTRLGRKE